MILTNEQEQILIGGLLGDFCLFTQKSAVNPLLSVTRSLKDLAYLQYQYNVFSKFCSQDITIHTKTIKGYDKIYGLCKFRTKGLPLLKPYKDKWYPTSIKVVPKDLQLSPLIASTWFCDDGCISKKETGQGLILKLATHGFSKDDVDFLNDLLSNTFSEKFHIYEEKSKFYIKGYTRATKKFVDYIKDVFPASMIRKFKHYGELNCQNGTQL